MKTVASSAKQRMWQVMRGLLTFTVDDLITLAEVESGNARKYIAALKKAEYIRLDGKRKAITRACRVYRLVKNTGPKAPLEANYKIYDPNLEHKKCGLKP